MDDRRCSSLIINRLCRNSAAIQRLVSTEKELEQDLVSLDKYALMFLCVAIKSSHRKPEDDKIIDSDICCAAGGAGGKLHTVPESAAARPEDASAWSVMLPLRPPVGCFGDTIFKPISAVRFRLSEDRL